MHLFADSKGAINLLDMVVCWFGRVVPLLKPNSEDKFTRAIINLRHKERPMLNSAPTSVNEQLVASFFFHGSVEPAGKLNAESRTSGSSTPTGTTRPRSCSSDGSNRVAATQRPRTALVRHGYRSGEYHRPSWHWLHKLLHQPSKRCLWSPKHLLVDRENTVRPRHHVVVSCLGRVVPFLEADAQHKLARVIDALSDEESTVLGSTAARLQENVCACFLRHWSVQPHGELFRRNGLAVDITAVVGLWRRLKILGLIEAL
mmetsp:Transcript_34309/g.103450  ORF Transcript_34309/g.103450 Transcript_34309/m.103450 type:complete len:259 (-) Transcript_34309:708-1484(-)